MSYREGHFDIEQSLGPPHPLLPLLDPDHPHHPVAEFYVQFWSLFHEQDHLFLSNGTIKQWF